MPGGAATSNPSATRSRIPDAGARGPALAPTTCDDRPGAGALAARTRGRAYLACARGYMCRCVHTNLVY
jgi:hypothetical protein